MTRGRSLGALRVFLGVASHRRRTWHILGALSLYTVHRIRDILPELLD